MLTPEMIECHQRNPQTGKWERTYILRSEWEKEPRKSLVDPETYELLSMIALRQRLNNPPSGESAP